MAESYYGRTSIFYVDRNIIGKWLKSIDPGYIKMLNEIRLSNKRFRISKDLGLHQLYERLHEESGTLCDFSEDSIHHITQVLRFEVVCGDWEKTKWVSLSDVVPNIGQRRRFSLFNARQWVEVFGSE